ncbi:MAG: PfkB family carbohydrate kinase [Rubrivivax sp.]
MSASPAPGLALVLGEALVDRFPDGAHTAGGAPFNVACWLALLQVPVRLVSRLGAQDAEAATVRQAARRAVLDLSDVQVDPELPTGVVDVTLAADGPSYLIRHPAAWDRLDRAQAVASVDGAQPAVVVFGTLARRDPVSADAIDAALAAASRTGALRLADLNLRSTPDDRAERGRAEAALNLADWAKVNDVELQVLMHWFAHENTSARPAPRRPAAQDDPHGPARAALMARFELKRLVVTCGAAGWYTVDETGAVDARGPAVAVPEVVDTVGAGDAFLATVAAGLCRRWPLAGTLRRAAQVAALACSHRGALPLDAASLAALKPLAGLAPTP